MTTLSVVGTLFVLSLLGAFTLFKFFKSTAIVKNKRYQAGGAIAGFIILYGTLYASYYAIEKGEYHRIVDEYKELAQHALISGTVSPLLDRTEIVLAVKQANPDLNGRFVLRVPCIHPNRLDGLRLYAIREDNHVFLNILSEEEMRNIRIPGELLASK